jgi:GT2 family glycosyltransferase
VRSPCLRQRPSADGTPDIVADGGSLLDSTGLLMQRNRRQVLRSENCVPASFRALARIFGPDGAAAFWRRTSLDDIRADGEVFDEDFFMHKEYIDIVRRAQLRGWRSANVLEASANHTRAFRPRRSRRTRVDARLRAVAVRSGSLLDAPLPDMLRKRCLIQRRRTVAWRSLCPDSRAGRPLQRCR